MAGIGTRRIGQNEATANKANRHFQRASGEIRAIQPLTATDGFAAVCIVFVGSVIFVAGPRCAVDITSEGLSNSGGRLDSLRLPIGDEPVS